MAGYLFGGNTGISSPQELEKRRAIADALAGSALRAPKDVGEGLTAIGQALAFRMMDRRNRKDAAAGQEQGNSAFASLFGGMGGPDASAPDMAGGTATAPQPPMDPASSRVAQAHGAGGENYRDAIASIESAGSGDYQAIGPTHPKLGRALGRYQVMEANIGPWSQEALGQAITPDQFMASPELQDKIFDHKFGSYVQKFGNPQDAASAWFTGQPLSKGANRKDVLGTSGAGYVDKFTNALGSAPQPPQQMTPDQIVQSHTAMRGAQPPPLPAPPGQNVMPMGLAAANPAPMQAPPPAMPPQPVQMAQAGQGQFPPAPQPPQANGRLQQLMQAAQNPWLTEQQRGMVNMMLKQEMEQMGPNAGLDAEFKRAQIDNIQSQVRDRENPNARDRFGNSVIWGQNPEGKWVAMQPSSSGGLVPAQTPEGINLVPPGVTHMDLGTSFGVRDRAGNVISNVEKNVAGEAAEAAGGKATGEAQAALPQVEAGFQSAMEQIDQLMNHPGLDASVGTWQGRIPDAVAGAMNSDVADFRARLQQAKGQTFLRAFEALKGGGAITEIEGLKAEQAIGRLNQAVSEDDFKQALTDLQSILTRGVDAYRKKAGGSAPSSASVQQKRLKFNPATGELE